MQLKSKKGVDIYHEYYINMDLKKMPLPKVCKIPVGDVRQILRWNKTVGDKVKKYDILAYLKGEIPIYSPFSGNFNQIETSPKIGSIAGLKYAVIYTEEDFSPSYPLYNGEEELTKASFYETIRKTAVFDDERRDYLFNTLKGLESFSCVVIDGFDDQPYNLSKTATILNYYNEVYEGAGFLLKVFGGKDIKLLINKNCQTDKFLNRYDEGITKITVGGKYPTLPVIDNFCEKENGIKIGAQTCRAIYRAVYFGEADLSRIITVWGDSIAEPSVVEVPFGVLAESLLKEFYAFGLIERVVGGGVMTGHTASLNFPVYKWESSLTVMPLKKHHNTTECIGCGRCALVCPMGLAPYYILRNSKFKGTLKAKELCVEQCILCGACGYICPSRLPLVDKIAKIKEREQNV